MGEIVRIDGSEGEGGGQILRTSLSLSAITGKPFEIFNIRKGRKKPGLAAQHLTSVRAAKAISNAAVGGDALGSETLSFAPQRIEPGEYHFNVAEEKGSAGSTMLVLQTILLPLSCADTGSRLIIEGGTHVPWSPPFHFISEIFARNIARLGFSFSASIERWGWYPKGGGLIRANIFPRKHTETTFRLEQKGTLISLKGISAVSNLPISIAERQKNEALRLLAERGMDADLSIVQSPSIGVGTFLFLDAQYEETSGGFSALGARGKRAEEVASDAVMEYLSYGETGAALDPHSADQIILYLAAIGGAHTFTTSRITQHLLTNIRTIRSFLPEIRIDVDGNAGNPGRISLHPK